MKVRLTVLSRQRKRADDYEGHPTYSAINRHAGSRSASPRSKGVILFISAGQLLASVFELWKSTQFKRLITV
jgi:hypothetical protein